MKVIVKSSCRKQFHLLNNVTNRQQRQPIHRPTKRMEFRSIRIILHCSDRHAVVSQASAAVNELLDVTDQQGSLRKREIPTDYLPFTNHLRIDLVLWGLDLGERLIRLGDRQL